MFQSKDALNAFLVIWLIVPVVFFSISASKLPGYIVPALPAGTLLLAEYVRRHIGDDERPRILLIVLHSVVAALPIVPAMMLQSILLQYRLPWSIATAISCGFAVVLVIGIVLTLRGQLGLRMLRFVTLVPVVLTVAAVLRLGAAALDTTLSARPLAAEISRMENKPVPLAIFRVSRETDYGLQFYRNQSIARYESGQVPSGEHLLVAPAGLRAGIEKRVVGRRVSYLGSFASQGLDYYWVSAPGMERKDTH